MKSQRGFTLIEIMIVLGIIASIMMVAVPRLTSKNTNINSVARKLLMTTRETRTKARLNNSTYRLVIKFDDKDPQYWVERASGPQKIDPEAYEKASEEKKGEEAPPPLFQADKSVMSKPRELPAGLRFGSLETINMKSPITSGEAYIHFSPEGFVEAAALQITDGNKLTWTLVFNPLTGQADIIEKAQSLKGLQR